MDCLPLGLLGIIPPEGLAGGVGGGNIDADIDTDTCTDRKRSSFR